MVVWVIKLFVVVAGQQRRRKRRHLPVLNPRFDLLKSTKKKICFISIRDFIMLHKRDCRIFLYKQTNKQTSKQASEETQSDSTKSCSGCEGSDVRTNFILTKRKPKIILSDFDFYKPKISKQWISGRSNKKSLYFRFHAKNGSDFLLATAYVFTIITMF